MRSLEIIRNTAITVDNIDKKTLSTRFVAEKLLKVMKHHIGLFRSIKRDDLFFSVYEIQYDKNKPSHWLLWDITSKAMHYLRKNSKCFITSSYNGTNHIYFVLSNPNEAGIYIKQMNNGIKRLESMKLKAEHAVMHEWHKRDWVIEDKKTQALEHDKKY